MTKKEIVKQVKEVIEKNGYLQVAIEGIHSAVDLIAEKKDKKLLIKVVENIDSVSRDIALELCKLADFIGAQPLIIGERSKNVILNEELIYKRFSISCVSVKGFEYLLDDVPQPIAAKGIGAKVRIDGTKLKEMRHINNISAEELAQKIKISKSSIYRYEHNYAYVSLEVANKINNFFKSRLDAEKEDVESNIYSNNNEMLLARTNVRALSVKRLPFNIIAKGKTNYYEIASEGDIRTLVKRAVVLKEIMETFKNNYSFFVIESDKKEIMDLPVIKKDTLYNINSEAELLEIIMS
ncbi:MAG: helix-turn-helix domain-containing protein [Candidatus Micrarchaeota archaeon]